MMIKVKSSFLKKEVIKLIKRYNFNSFFNSIFAFFRLVNWSCCFPFEGISNIWTLKKEISFFSKALGAIGSELLAYLDNLILIPAFEFSSKYNHLSSQRSNFFFLRLLFWFTFCFLFVLWYGCILFDDPRNVRLWLWEKDTWCVFRLFALFKCILLKYIFLIRGRCC